MQRKVFNTFYNIVVHLLLEEHLSCVIASLQAKQLKKPIYLTSRVLLSTLLQRSTLFYAEGLYNGLKMESSRSHK